MSDPVNPDPEFQLPNAILTQSHKKENITVLKHFCNMHILNTEYSYDVHTTQTLLNKAKNFFYRKHVQGMCV